MQLEKVLAWTREKNKAQFSFLSLLSIYCAPDLVENVVCRDQKLQPKIIYNLYRFKMHHSFFQ